MAKNKTPVANNKKPTGDNMLEHDTLMAYLDQWATEKPDEIWLRDLKGEGSDDYTWSESRRQIHAVASALEARYAILFPDEA